MITFSDNIARKPYLGSTEIAEVWLGNVLIYPEDTVDYSTQYLTFEVVEDGTINFVATDESVSKTISYSLDNGKKWTNLTSSTSYQSMGGTLRAGDKVLVKGRNNTYASNDRGDYNHFVSTAKVNVSGNIMSLISGDNFVDNKTLTEDNTFYRLFADNAKLLSAKNLILSATTLTSFCYYEMFWNCANFTTAPSVLPATTLAQSCYSDMFIDCTNLVNIPSILPATTLAQNCYYAMFQGCTSLTTAPELPATILAVGCYQNMFRNCTSLTIAPSLPATTLVNLCYSNMFQDCRKLNYIKAMFTTTPGTNTTYWVNGVASTGTFVKNSAATWDVRGVNGVPSGWTIETEYPKIHKKYRATYSNSTTVDGDCDGNNIVINEVTKSGLKTIVIGECVPAIVGECFADCTNLTSVIIEGNTSIDNYSFARNNGHLTSITMYSTTPPSCKSTAFTYYNGGYVPMTSIKIYVPSQSVNAYKAASGWSTYASKIQAIP